MKFKRDLALYQSLCYDFVVFKVRCQTLSRTSVSFPAANTERYLLLGAAAHSFFLSFFIITSSTTHLCHTALYTLHSRLKKEEINWRIDRLSGSIRSSKLSPFTSFRWPKRLLLLLLLIAKSPQKTLNLSRKKRLPPSLFSWLIEKTDVIDGRLVTEKRKNFLYVIVIINNKLK